MYLASIQLVTDIATKPWLSGNMLSNKKHTKMDDWMIEFLRKIENRCTKIVRVNSNLIPKSINFMSFTLILWGVGARCDRKRFKVHSPFIEKSMGHLIRKQWPMRDYKYLYRQSLLIQANFENIWCNQHSRVIGFLNHIVFIRLLKL